MKKNVPTVLGTLQALPVVFTAHSEREVESKSRTGALFSTEIADAGAHDQRKMPVSQVFSRTLDLLYIVLQERNSASEQGGTSQSLGFRTKGLGQSPCCR